jgi:Collagen triple helix repeat (20 copies)
MHRLRHPIRSITEPFGKAGLTVAILALVLAMVGGAFAAGGLTKPQEKQVKKIAKKYAGKPGAPGTNGTNGTNGTAGAPGKEGPQGKEGPEGKAGTNGTNGTNGTSVVTGTLEPGQGSPPCVEGGVTIEVEGSGTKKQVCNGEEGKAGPKGAEGPPGPLTETLPSGKTLKGLWGGHTDQVNGLGLEMTPTSFPFRVENGSGEPPTPIFIKFGEPTPAGCTGNEGNPGAEPGNLCVFEGESENVNPGFGPIVTPLTIGFKVAAAVEKNEPGGFRLEGTWAVTAP